MENNFNAKVSRPIPLRSYALGIATLWSLFLALSLLWNAKINKLGTIEAARIEARTNLKKDIMYRHWNAGHGGVYAPVTEETPPNPYLDVPEREITTPSGQKLTKINPAYMTRQVHELAMNTNTVKDHITSLNPIRPANAPDTWETLALKAFETGVKEVSSVEEMEGKEYMRLMQPLSTKKGCLKCHARQGHQLGDIRGGLSTSLPMAPFKEIAQSYTLTLSVAHGLLWLLGLFGIGWGMHQLNHQIQKRMGTEEALQESEEKYRTLFANAGDALFIMEVDPENRSWIIECNQRTLSLFGCESNDIIGKSPALFSSETQPDGKASMENIIETTKLIMEGNPQDFLWRHHRYDNKKPSLVEVHLSRLTLGGKSNYMQAVVRDITERKQAEEALSDSEKKYRTLFESSRDAIMTLAPPDWKFTAANLSSIKMFMAKDEQDFISRVPWELSPEYQPDGKLSSIKSKNRIDKAMAVGTNFFEWTHQRLNNEEFPATVLLSRIEFEGKQLLQATVRDITNRKRIEEDREKLINELQEALNTIITLKGMLPICSQCKKIRDDKGYWNQIEGYIESHSEAEFSHGLCPECMDKLYGDQDWYNKKDRNK